MTRFRSLKDKRAGSLMRKYHHNYQFHDSRKKKGEKQYFTHNARKVFGFVDFLFTHNARKVFGFVDFLGLF